MSLILFKNCTLLDTSSKEPKALKDHYVLVEGNLIKQVSPRPLAPSHAEEYDLKGKTLMPGLIDAHVHITAAEIDLANEHIPEAEVTIQASRFLENMLQRGFTSVRDAGGADFGLAHAIIKGLIKGPRLFYSGKALSQTGGHGDFRKLHQSHCFYCHCASASNISRLADGIVEVQKASRDELRKGATQIKIMASGGVASPTDKITNWQYSVEEIKAIVEETKSHGTYVMAHAYDPHAIKRCVENGVRSIEHGNLLDKETALLMAQHGVYLVPTLVIYQSLSQLGPKLGFPQESLRKLEDVRSQGLEAIKIARSCQVKIGFGTDLLGVEGHLMQSQEFMIRASIESPGDTLYSATAVNAELLQHKDKLGIIKPEAYADLLVVNSNPLENIEVLCGQGENLDLIMKDGIIYKNRLKRG